MRLEEIRKNKPPKLTVKEAAEIMNVTPRVLQMALQQNKFDFGVAVESDRWVYYINTERFLNYMGGGRSEVG